MLIRATVWWCNNQPSWKMMDFVNGKDDIPYIDIHEMENSPYVWNHQPGYHIIVGLHDVNGKDMENWKSLKPPTTSSSKALSISWECRTQRKLFNLETPSQICTVLRLGSYPSFFSSDPSISVGPCWRTSFGADEKHLQAWIPHVILDSKPILFLIQPHDVCRSTLHSC